MKDLKGTNFITGLNVGKAPHTIEDHELTKSLNGWTEKEGTWSCAPSHSVEYTGYSAISCFAAGRIDGEDHTVWMDGNTVYVDGESVGSFTAGTDMKITPVDDGFLFTGASKPYIYHKSTLHELGGPQLDEITNTGIWSITPASASVTSITAASSAVLTVPTSLYAGVGEYIYLTGVTDMPDINEKTLQVTATSGSGPYEYTLDADTSSYSGSSTSGTAYGTACGLTGDYKYYVVPAVRLSSGYTLYGRPRGLRRDGFWNTLGVTDSWDAETITLTPTDGIAIKARLLWEDAGTATYDIGGTRGTDYDPGLLLYRTKAGGSDIYLEKEWWHGDSDFTFVSATDDYYYTGTYNGGPQDIALGDVWDTTLSDRYRPPAGSVCSTVGQRVYIADENAVYWSSLDDVNYWSAVSSTNMSDTVTAMGQIRGNLAIFSGDRLWAMAMYDGLPDISEIDTPVGTVWHKAMTTIDAGLLFLREDGLWLFDGASVKNIARRAFDYLATPKSICASGDTIYMSGESASYIVRIRDGGWIWHEGDGTYDMSHASNGHIYAASQSTVVDMFQGNPAGGIFTTKSFGGFQETKQYRVVLDVEGQGRAAVSINGVRQSDIGPHNEALPVATGGRRLVRYPVPRLANSYFSMTVVVPGSMKVHGYSIEVER